MQNELFFPLQVKDSIILKFGGQLNRPKLTNSPRYPAHAAEQYQPDMYPAKFSSADFVTQRYRHPRSGCHLRRYLVLIKVATYCSYCKNTDACRMAITEIAN